jgi:hypothetical protein
VATEAAWLNGTILEKEEIKNRKEKKQKNGRKALTLTGLLMEGVMRRRWILFLLGQQNPAARPMGDM